jgi:hypothetical protein
MVHHRVMMAVLHASQLLVTQSDRAHPLFGCLVFKWDVPFLSKLFCSPHALAIQAIHRFEFFFIEHWHFASTSPTPHLLHETLSAA